MDIGDSTRFSPSLSFGVPSSSHGFEDDEKSDSAGGAIVMEPVACGGITCSGTVFSDDDDRTVCSACSEIAASADVDAM